MEIKIEKSIMVLILSLKISANLGNHMIFEEHMAYTLYYRAEQCCVQGL